MLFPHNFSARSSDWLLLHYCWRSGAAGAGAGGCIHSTTAASLLVSMVSKRLHGSNPRLRYRLHRHHRYHVFVLHRAAVAAAAAAVVAVAVVAAAVAAAVVVVAVAAVAAAAVAVVAVAVVSQLTRLLSPCKTPWSSIGQRRLPRRLRTLTIVVAAVAAAAAVAVVAELLCDCCCCSHALRLSRCQVKGSCHPRCLPRSLLLEPGELRPLLLLLKCCFRPHGALLCRAMPCHFSRCWRCYI